MVAKGKNEGMTRREFLLNTAVGAGLVASFGTGAVYAYKFVVPKKKPVRLHKVYLCPLQKIPPGGTFEFEDMQGKKAILINLDGKIKAFSQICTHLGCTVEWRPDKKEFYCPCHEGRFDVEGRVLSGPPPRPLDEFEVVVEENLVYVKLKETV